MRVIATLTIDGIRETRIEGECPYMSGGQGDRLEIQGLGVWLSNWRDNLAKGRSHHRSKVFIPWSSCLYIETREAKGRQGRRVSRLERKTQ